MSSAPDSSRSPERKSSWWRPLVGIDVRSLAAFRISIALILIYDLITRMYDLEAHYADTGVMPRVDLLKWKDTYSFSLHMMSGLWWVQGILFVAALVAAVYLLVGRHTRLATIASWIFLASLHARNPLIQHGGDSLLRLMLFWAVFVPLGRAFSIDSLLAKGHTASPSRDSGTWVVSMGTLALKLQLCGMYWTTAALKWHPVWVEDGTAVMMALKLDQLVTPFGRFLTQWPEMLQMATFGTMVLEIAGPMLAFVPFFTAPLQMFTVVLFAGFHIFGLAPALYLGTFPFICAACWLIFIPNAFWDRWRFNIPKQDRLEAFFRQIGLAWIRLSGDKEHVVRRPGPGQRFFGWMTQALVAVLIVYVAMWNLRTTNFSKYEKVFPKTINWVSQAFHLGQYWALFAPFPATEDGWFIFEGTTAGGEIIEARTGGEVSFEKPENVSEAMGRKRWKKYLMNLEERQNGVHRRMYGRYLCRQWNADRTGDARMASIRMYMVRERTLPNGDEQEPMRGVLWNQVCVLADESVKEDKKN